MESQSLPQNSPKLFRQTLLVWLFTMLALRGLFELQRIPSVARNLSLLMAMVLIYVPLFVLWKKRQNLDVFEKSFRQVLRSLGYFFLLAVLIFPLLELGNRYFQDIFFHRHYVGGHYQGLIKIALFQVIWVAFPEEFFYRGYLQAQFNRVWGRPKRLFGAPIGWALPFTALLFALSHSLIMLRWWHFAIFFPALAFGWLRERTGAISAGVLFHALCNVYSVWVMMNYR